MLSTQLKKLADQNGWRINAEEESAYGDYNGYLFTAIEGKKFKGFLTSVAGISQEGLKALTKFLDEHHKSLRLRNFQLDDNFICIRQQESLIPLSVDKMEHLLAQISGLLDLYELPTDACAVCGEKAKTKGLYYGLLCHLHPECESRDLVDFINPPAEADDQMDEPPNDTAKKAQRPARPEQSAAAGLDAQSDSVTFDQPDSPDAAISEDQTDEPHDVSEQPGRAGDASEERSEADKARMSQKLDELALSMQAYKQDMTDALAGLCAIPSTKGTPGPNAPFGDETVKALDYFLKLGEKLGFRSCNLDNYAGYVEWGEGDKLIAVLCHLDVVPAGDGWKHDPWQAVVTPDRIIARGTSDDKGPAIASLYAMKALADSGFQPDCRVRLILGLDEESGMTCMKYYRQHADLPDAGFTADAGFPTIYAEKGVLWLKLAVPHGELAESRSLQLMSGKAGERPNMVPALCRLNWRHFSEAASGGYEDETVNYEGIPAHAAEPESGKNAIAIAMQDAADKLAQAHVSHPFVDLFQTYFKFETNGQSLGIQFEDESGESTVNAGVLAIDAEHSELLIDIRYPVTQDSQTIISQIEKDLLNYNGTVKIVDHMKPLYLPKDSNLVRILTDVYNTLTGDNSEPIAMGGGTYARTMPNIVAYGPGFDADESTAHQVDEAITFRSFLASAAIYREALKKLAEDIVQ